MAETDRFLTEGGRAALAEASSRILATANSDRVRRIVAGNETNEDKKDFLINLVKYGNGVPPDEPLLKVALDQQLLEIVAAYLEMWPTLFSIAAWLNYPTDQPPAVSQLWHRDPEDLRLIKVFIYLSDVEEHSGPFSYIPAHAAVRRCGRTGAAVRQFTAPVRCQGEQGLPALDVEGLHRQCRIDDPCRHRRLSPRRQADVRRPDSRDVHLHLGDADDDAQGAGAGDAVVGIAANSAIRHPHIDIHGTVVTDEARSLDRPWMSARRSRAKEILGPNGRSATSSLSIRPSHAATLSVSCSARIYQ